MNREHAAAPIARHEFRRAMWIMVSVGVMLTIFTFAILGMIPSHLGHIWWTATAVPMTGLIALRREWRARLAEAGEVGSDSNGASTRPAYPNTPVAGPSQDTRRSIESELGPAVIAGLVFQTYLIWMMGCTTILAIWGPDVLVLARLPDAVIVMVIVVIMFRHMLDANVVMRTSIDAGTSGERPLPA